MHASYANQMQQWAEDLDEIDTWEASQILNKVQSRIKMANYPSGSRGESEIESKEVEKRIKKKGSIY